MLLERGADPDRVNDRGQTALGAAVFRRSPESVGVLLDHGADAHAGGRSAAEIARFFELDDMAALLEHGRARRCRVRRRRTLKGAHAHERFLRVRSAGAATPPLHQAPGDAVALPATDARRRGAGHGVTALHAAPGERDDAGDDDWTENRPPRRGLPRLELSEAWHHRDLGIVLAQRTLKVRYRQTMLGVAWALLQPLAGLVVFTIVFGRLAKLPSEGLPYAVFVYPAMCLWTYVSVSVSAAAAELPQNPHLVTRVYFPRILSPAAAVVPGLLDFTVALALTPILMVIYDIAPGPQVLLVPLWIAAAAIVAFGVGTWLAAINVKYRDVRQVLPFLLQTWFFLSPMVFASSLVSDDWRTVYALNPLVGLVDGLRWSLVGGARPPPADVASLLSAVVTVVSGLYYFRSVEVSFADVI